MFEIKSIVRKIGAIGTTIVYMKPYFKSHDTNDEICWNTETTEEGEKKDKTRRREKTKE